MKIKVYADYAATTPLSPAVLDVMNRAYLEYSGNPSSVHKAGRDARIQLKKARDQAAELLGAQPTEIYFTSCGTESNNWVIRSFAESMRENGKNHIISSRFEHHAILNPLKTLEKEGFDVTYLDVHEDGIIRPHELEAAIRPDTGLVTIVYANNEIGTIQPIAEIGEICKGRDIPFHTDAVQAAAYIPIDVKKQNISMLSLSAHKFHGPRGSGLLYSDRPLYPLLEGGEQERGHRAGTENLPGIMGLAAALQLTRDTMEDDSLRITALRERLIDGLLAIEGSHLNGSRTARLPGNANISFDSVEGESLLLMLDMKGICASSGSACTSGSLSPSHVIKAMGLPDSRAKGSMRFSLGRLTTAAEVEYIIETVTELVGKLRFL